MVAAIVTAVAYMASLLAHELARPKLNLPGRTVAAKIRRPGHCRLDPRIQHLSG